MTHTPDPQLLERPIKVLVVGCGAETAAPLPQAYRICRGTPNLTCLPPDVPSFARANHRSHSVISGRALRHGRARTADVDARSTSV
jgi:hypothetical protein